MIFLLCLTKCWNGISSQLRIFLAKAVKLSWSPLNCPGTRSPAWKYFLCENAFVNITLPPWMLLALEFSSPNASDDIVPGFRETVQVYLYWQSYCIDSQGVQGGSHPQNVGGLQ